MNVCFCSDKNLFPHLAVAIFSVLKNASVPCNIYFVTYNEMPDDLLGSLIKLCEVFKSTFNLVSCSPIALSQFSVQERPEGYDITVGTYLKILLPSVLKEVDRVIYLDVDVVVEGDLNELWKTDLGDNLIGLSRLGDIRLYQYNFTPSSWNSAVILMDLAGMRDMGFQEKADVLNKSLDMKNTPRQTYTNENEGYILITVCGDRIKRIPLKFNFGTWSVYPNLEDLAKVCGEGFVDSIVVYHYGGVASAKAWNRQDSRYFKYQNQLQSLHLF